MTTSNKDLHSVILEAEAELKNNQSRYKTRLLLYSLLGYAVIFILLGVLIFLIVGGIGLAVYSTAFLLLLLKKKLIIPLALMVWVLFKSLWVRVEEPKGYTLNRSQCPALFSELDDLQQKLKTPPVDEVILTHELNAGVQQTPRLGIFGWHKTTLILGLELLLVLSREEARAVLAHELGHLSGNHSRFNGWIYRSRQSWYRIMDELGTHGGFGTGIIRKYFNWYAPRFSAYSFALARLNEYEADAVSAELTSPQVATNALLNVHAIGPYLDEDYWGSYFKTAEEVAKPAHTPFIGLRNFVASHVPPKDLLQAKVSEAMEWQTTYDDTHPSLKDRIKALGGEVCIPATPQHSAAQDWLGQFLDKAIEDFDKDWLTYNLEKWEQRYATVQTEKQKLAELKDKIIDSLQQDDHWALVALSERYEPDTDALAMYRSYRERYPDDAYASFAIGRLMLDNNDEHGLDELRKAAALPDVCVDACRIAYYYLIKNQREKEAEEWRDMANRQMEIDQEAQQERDSVTLNDTLNVPAVEQAVSDALGKQLHNYPEVKKAWLAQKVVKHYPEYPVLIFAVELAGFDKAKKQVLQRILQEIESPFTVFGVANMRSTKSIFRFVKKSGVKLS